MPARRSPNMHVTSIFQIIPCSKKYHVLKSWLYTIGGRGAEFFAENITDDNKHLLKPVDKENNVSLHISCHSRAQNIGQKATELLRLIPQLKLDVIERCSGHGGSWGIKKNNFEMAIKVGKPVARKVIQFENEYVVSECPLAGTHIQQGVNKIDNSKNVKV